MAGGHCFLGRWCRVQRLEATHDHRFLRLLRPSIAVAACRSRLPHVGLAEHVAAARERPHRFQPQYFRNAAVLIAPQGEVPVHAAGLNQLAVVVFRRDDVRTELADRHSRVAKEHGYGQAVASRVDVVAAIVAGESGEIARSSEQLVRSPDLAGALRGQLQSVRPTHSTAISPADGAVRGEAAVIEALEAARDIVAVVESVQAAVLGILGQRTEAGNRLRRSEVVDRTPVLFDTLRDKPLSQSPQHEIGVEV